MSTHKLSVATLGKLFFTTNSQSLNEIEGEAFRISTCNCPRAAIRPRLIERGITALMNWLAKRLRTLVLQVKAAPLTAHRGSVPTATLWTGTTDHRESAALSLSASGHDFTDFHLACLYAMIMTLPASVRRSRLIGNTPHVSYPPASIPQ